MTVSLKRWGKSLALGIPKDIAKTLHVDENSLMELSIEDDTLILRTKKDDLLENLVSQINESNLHREIKRGMQVEFLLKYWKIYKKKNGHF